MYVLSISDPDAFTCIIAPILHQVFMVHALSDASTLRQFPILRMVVVHIEAVPEYHLHITESRRIKTDMTLKERERGKVHYEAVNQLIAAIYNEYYPVIGKGLNVHRTAIAQSRRQHWVIGSMLLHQPDFPFLSLLARSSNRSSLRNNFVHKIIGAQMTIKQADLKGVLMYQMRDILRNGTFNVCIHSIYFVSSCLLRNCTEFIICGAQRFGVIKEDERSMTIWIETSLNPIVGLPYPPQYDGELFIVRKQSNGGIQYQTVNNLIEKIFVCQYGRGGQWAGRIPKY